ncbi:SDR family NAD(P)-dependent oxidoreductase [Dongia soli]|uniref:SDR family oxidoreductase n=1 Tax=Dongia soli TaxID=600628 RepID=A0ABU5EHF5_9PROT|nr:SDR family oxidoreductase [Dongia soli]MDY0885668.1 SDR family oxidoreductase [Dongia soli]
MANSSLFDLSGEIAFVTGASAGLGRHFASVLAEAGAKVALCARRRDLVAQAVAALPAGRALAVVGDVTDGASMQRALRQAGDELGPVTLLINNAGIADDHAALDLPEDDWDRVIDINLKGAWRLSQLCAQHWVERGAPGNIVNIASILALRVAGRSLPYAVSKAGLVQMTKALSLEWARHGIRVNAIAPGYIETDLNRDFFATAPGQALIKRIPQRRLGQPGDLDGALLLLASSASAYMTGSVVTVDGGHLNSSL